VGSRIASTIVLWGAILGGLYFFGAHAAVVGVTVVAALALFEFYAMAEKMGARPFRGLGILCSVLLTAGPFYALARLEREEMSGLEPFAMHAALLFGALLVTCIRVLGERDVTNRVGTIASTMLGLVCVPYLLQFLVLILMRDASEGENLALVLWLVAVSKFCDVGALLSGMAFGKHKMSPHISPKKTWEGAIGGVCVSAGVGAGIAALAAAHLPESLTPLMAAGIAIPLAVVTIVSDLIESVLKRWADVKDSGKMIPGIGGALDLVDSLLLTGPLAYFIFVFLA
jgi:phosphatidate cytidylyltransferase